MDIEALIDELEGETGGRIAYALHDLGTDEVRGYNAEEPVSTASVIKLPLLAHVALCAEAGELAWGEPLALTEAVKVPGSGILKELSAGLAVNVRDLCVLMTALSDNTATNMLIDRVGVEAVNRRIAGLGMERTRLLRRAYSPDTPESIPYGLGVTTPAEMTGLLARVARRQIGDDGAAEATLAMLAMQQDRAGIPRLLPEGWAYAGKTGSISALRADAALLTAPDGRGFALSIFCSAMPRVDWGVDNPGLLAIARLARALLAP